MKKSGSEISEEIRVKNSGQISVKFTERIGVDSSEQLVSNLVNKLRAVPLKSFVSKLGVPKFGPSPSPTSYVQGPCQRFEKLF